MNLDAKENLLDSDSRAPVLLLVQDGQAHLQNDMKMRAEKTIQNLPNVLKIYRAAGVDIRVEERGHKLDLRWDLKKFDLN